METRYDFTFTENSPYAHIVRLLKRHGQPAGLVLDLGCGVGAVAEPLADLGFTYVGCDIDSAGLDRLRQRGFEVHHLDLAELEPLPERIVKLADGRPVSAILMLDALEHLPDTGGFLERLRVCTLELGRPLLGLSIPNIGHFDVGAKLATGRWDVMPTGLLDETHLQFFTEGRLMEVMERWGWFQLAADDLELHHSDQHFPIDHPALADGAPLRDLLWRLRRRIGADLTVNQFVRLFALAAVRGEPPGEEDGPPAPFLSVLVRTQGRRMATLLEALTCLAAQTDDDLEVLVLVHTPAAEVAAEVRQLVGVFAPEFAGRVHVHQVSDGGRARPLNLGIDVARGRYLAFLDDDDLVTADWAERFRMATERAPGRIIRSVTADRAVRRAEEGEMAPYTPLGGLRMAHTPTFNVMEHFWQNRTPICSFAAPMDAVRVLGLRFDDQAAVLEDWSFLMELSVVCGVYDTEKVTSVYHRWEGPDSSLKYVDAGVWETTRMHILQQFDEGPLLLPSGTASRLAELWKQTLLAGQARDDLSRRLADQQTAAKVTEKALRADAEELRDQIKDLYRHLDDARQQAIDARSQAAIVGGEVAAIRASRTWRAASIVGNCFGGVRAVRSLAGRVLRR